MIWNRFFSAAYDYFMIFLEKPHLRTRRKRLISGLSGKILEVGVGTGVNFEHYSDKIELIGIEPSPYMISQAKKRKEISLNPDGITLHNIGCSYPEMERLIEPESLDFVVCTLVLCTVPEPEKAVGNFMKWLRPGGHLLVLEHIRSHHKMHRKIQDFFNPAWEKIAAGCQLNRPTDKIISEAGFRLRREDRFKIGLPFYEAEYEKPLKK